MKANTALTAEALPRQAPASDNRGGHARPWGFLAVLLLLCGYLLFAHGCHGDEDNELFAPTAAVSGSVANASGSDKP
jgi:hypothetical protein